MPLSSQPVALWSLAQIENLTTSDIKNLTPAQVKSFSLTQFRALSRMQFQALTKAQLQSLDPTQISNVQTDRITWDNWANALTPQQLSWFLPNQISALSQGQISSLSNTKFAALTTQQIAALTSAQISSISWDNWKAALNPTQLSAFTPVQVRSFSLAQLQSLNRQQFQALTKDQIQAFDPSQISNTQTDRITWDNWANALTPQQLSWFLPTQISALSLGQISSLSTTKFATLTTQQIAALTPAQISSISWDNWKTALTPMQVSAFTPAQVKSFSLAQFQSLSRQQFQALTRDQIQAFDPSQISNTQTDRITWDNWANALTPQQLSWFLPTQISALSQGQIGSLNLAKFAALTPSQLAAITVNQLSAITPAQIGSLNQSQFAALNTSPLTTSQVKGLGATQTQWLKTKLSTDNLVDLAYRSMLTDSSISTDFLNSIISLRSDIQSNTDLKKYFSVSQATPYYNMPVTGLFGSDINSFIDKYDTWYRSTAHNNADVTALAKLLQNRQYISTSAVALSKLTTDVSAMFTWLTGAHDALVPKSAPATGTDIAAYCLTVNNTLGNTLGQFKALLDLTSAVSNDATTLGSVTIDAVTGEKLSEGVIAWLMNGASASSTVLNNVSYSGTNNLSYYDALKAAEQDLLESADKFCVTANSGIDQVVKNKSVADKKALLSAIFDILGGVASLSAGIGKTITAYQTIAVSGPVSAANQIKWSSELTADINIASGIIKNQQNDWLKPSSSAVTNTPQYNGISKLPTQLDALFDKNIPSELSATEALFMTDLKKLVSNINNHLKQGNDMLADLGPSLGLDNHDQTITYKDFNNNSHNITVNPKKLFSGAQGNIYVDGPEVPGYLSTQWEQTQTKVSYGDRQPGTYTVTRVHLIGHNPI